MTSSRNPTPGLWPMVPASADFAVPVGFSRHLACSHSYLQPVVTSAIGRAVYGEVLELPVAIAA